MTLSDFPMLIPSSAESSSIRLPLIAIWVIEERGDRLMGSDTRGIWGYTYGTPEVAQSIVSMQELNELKVPNIVRTRSNC
jgi:hypothetical protein